MSHTPRVNAAQIPPWSRINRNRNRQPGMPDRHTRLTLALTIEHCPLRVQGQGEVERCSASGCNLQEHSTVPAVRECAGGDRIPGPLRLASSMCRTSVGTAAGQHHCLASPPSATFRARHWCGCPCVVMRSKGNGAASAYSATGWRAASRESLLSRQPPGAPLRTLSLEAGDPWAKANQI